MRIIAGRPRMHRRDVPRSFSCACEQARGPTVIGAKARAGGRCPRHVQDGLRDPGADAVAGVNRADAGQGGRVLPVRFGRRPQSGIHEAIFNA
ncbi:MAG: hypothetical protein ACTHOH_01815 [Lysobacteraceae bacterium]